MWKTIIYNLWDNKIAKVFKTKYLPETIKKIREELRNKNKAAHITHLTQSTGEVVIRRIDLIFMDRVLIAQIEAKLIKKSNYKQKIA